jgi:hypothetical protein
MRVKENLYHPKIYRKTVPNKLKEIRYKMLCFGDFYQWHLQGLLAQRRLYPNKQ